MDNSPEKQSDYVKRVLFGGGGSSKAAPGDKQAGGGGGNRSESHSSTSSAPSTAIYSMPGTPRNTTAGEAACVTVPVNDVEPMAFVFALQA